MSGGNPPPMTPPANNTPPPSGPPPNNTTPPQTPDFSQYRNWTEVPGQYADAYWQWAGRQSQMQQGNGVTNPDGTRNNITPDTVVRVWARNPVTGAMEQREATQAQARQNGWEVVTTLNAENSTGTWNYSPTSSFQSGPGQPPGGTPPGNTNQPPGNNNTPPGTNTPPANTAPTAEQLMQAINGSSTTASWAGSQDIFGDQGVGQQNYYVPNTSTTGHGLDQGLVQALITNYGPAVAQQIIARDMNADSPAARVAQSVRDQQTAQSSLPSMFNDLRNVPQLYANPVTRALLPENIRQAEQVRLQGGPDWRIASFGDAIDGNNVTRAVSPDSFVAPTRANDIAPSAAQRQQNMVADFVNSWLPHMNDPGARGLGQTYDVGQLNSAIAASPAQMQSVIANRLTGLNPQQLQLALTTSGLSLPQFLAQAVTRLAG